MLISDLDKLIRELVLPQKLKAVENFVDEHGIVFTCQGCGIMDSTSDAKDAKHALENVRCDCTCKEDPDIRWDIY